MTVTELADEFGRKPAYLRLSATARRNRRRLYAMPQEGMPFTARNRHHPCAQIVETAAAAVRPGAAAGNPPSREPTERRTPQMGG
ncbi:hypothetical protein [Cohnella cellulosilytica]|uniref:Uncharacterized protein n=1 Tax=Cohnella cellulosilytica TaxID=986710 RepID=A0ABW2F6Q9_9BACL